MIQRFLNYINENNLFHPHEKVLLAVSGGIDSVVLAYLCKHINLNFSIAHCNFQLRGNEAFEDEQFVKSLAHELGVTCHVTRFETEQYSLENKISIQMAARELRYAWFRDVKQEFNYQYIATAHHANDQVETVLLNLAKGTGLKGVRGILPKHNGLVRPLLFAQRSEIENFALKHHIQWREDQSNVSVKYQRNAIRHLIVPEFEKINPNFILSVNQFTNRMMELEQMVEERVLYWKSKLLNIVQNVHYLHYALLDNVTYKDLILYELLKEYGFDNVEEIVQCTSGISGKSFISNQYWLVVDRNQFVITKIDDDQPVFAEMMIDSKKIILPNQIITFGVEDYQSKNFESSLTALFNYSKLVFPLVIRNWRIGDKFKPLGMGGKSKKVSDLLIDLKVPLNLKKKVLVIESQGNIIWVVGYRTSEEYKVLDQSSKVFKISIE
jgi:tRNA(Ile)-lysidine synthase